MKFTNSAITIGFFSNLVAAVSVFPTEDPFYTPPSGFESYPLGSIIKTRPVPSPLNLTYESAFQIMYRTSSALGGAEADITTVVVPKNASTQGRQLVSYQIPEDSVYIGCAPSYWMQSIFPEIDASMQMILDQGYFLNVPDYEGSASSFTAGIKAGQSTLDSVTAVLTSKNLTGVAADAEIILWGYSGGSVAAGWAAELLTSYAPELKVAATIIGGVVANVSAVLNYINGGPYAGFVAGGLTGLASQYPDVAEVLKARLLSNATTMFDRTNDVCYIEYIPEFSGENAFIDYFGEGPSILDNPIIRQVYDNNTLGSTKPGSPIYVYQGVLDEISPVTTVDETIDRYCEEGADIAYFKDPDASHFIMSAVGQPFAMSLIGDIFGSKTSISGCVTKTTNMGVSASATATSSTTDATTFTTSTSSGPSEPAISTVSTNGAKVNSAAVQVVGALCLVGVALL